MDDLLRDLRPAVQLQHLRGLQARELLPALKPRHREVMEGGHGAGAVAPFRVSVS